MTSLGEVSEWRSTNEASALALLRQAITCSIHRDGAARRSRHHHLLHVYSGAIAALVFFPIHAAILLVAAVVLWFALYRRLGGAGPWAISLLSAPVIVVLALPAIGIARPYVKLAENYSRYMSEVRAQEGLGPRYATWDWTDHGGFVPPQVWLVYDESDRTAGQKID